MEDYGRAIELNPEYATAYNNRLILAAQLNQHNVAVNDLKQLLILRGEQFWILSSLALQYALLGERDKFVETVGKARQLTEGESAYALACFAAIQEDVAEACRLLTEALEADGSQVEWAAEDPDFVLIREHPAFQQVIATYRQKLLNE